MPPVDQEAFFGATTSRAEVIIYPHTQDRILGPRPEVIRFRGRSAAEPEASLISCRDSATMGEPAASAEAEIRPPPGVDMSRLILDGDWMDVIYRVGSRLFHVFRGPIQHVHRNRTTRPNGATSKTWQIQAAGFGTCLEEPLWFNQHAGEYAPFAYANVQAQRGDLLGAPNRVVNQTWRGFLGTFNDRGRATWELPTGVPGRTGDGSFVANTLFHDRDFKGLPDRGAFNLQLINPGAPSVWGLMRSFADLPVCELYPAILDGRASNPCRHPRPGEQIGPQDTTMALVFRDRPLPLVGHEDLAPGTKTDLDSPWFSLPLAEVPTRGIASDSVGRGWLDHRNVFVATPELGNAFRGSDFWVLQAPLLDPEDVRRFGVRLMDTSTAYMGEGGVFAPVIDMRRRIQQWNCLHRYFYSGEISLNHPRPDVRIGTRLRVLGKTPDDHVTYYVQQVSNSWEYNRGCKTSVGVTRGWKGTDSSLLRALKEKTERFIVARNPVNIENLPNLATPPTLIV